MQNPLISVVIPIYNVEQYMRECVDSVISQTYCHLEIILVDDGSPDNCPAICDEYAKKDCRIKVIHQENGGLAHARNVGITNSNGDYLTFIDSDDFVSKDYIETLYKGLVESNADISIASFNPFKGNVVDLHFLDFVVFSDVQKKDAIRRYCSINAECSMPFISACNKIYRRVLFEGIAFPKGRLYEDAFTTYKLIDRARKIVFTTSKLYFYRINPQSILGQSFKEKHLEMIEAFRSGLDFFDQKGEKEIASMFIPPLLVRCIYCWWGTKIFLKNQNLAKKVLNDYRNNCKKIKYRKQLSLLWFVLFKLISFCPWLYLWYRKLSPAYLGDRR